MKPKHYYVETQSSIVSFAFRTIARTFKSVIVVELVYYYFQLEIIFSQVQDDLRS